MASVENIFVSVNVDSHAFALKTKYLISTLNMNKSKLAIFTFRMGNQSGFYIFYI